MKRISSFLLVGVFILLLAACNKPIDRNITFHGNHGLTYTVYATQVDNKIFFSGTVQNKSKKPIDITYGNGTLRIKTKNGVTPFTVFLLGHKKSLKPNEKVETNTVEVPYEKDLKSVKVILEVMIDKEIYKTAHKMTLKEK